jgi:hypothetical protein
VSAGLAIAGFGRHFYKPHEFGNRTPQPRWLCRGKTRVRTNAESAGRPAIVDESDAVPPLSGVSWYQPSAGFPTPTPAHAKASGCAASGRRVRRGDSETRAPAAKSRSGQTEKHAPISHGDHSIRLDRWRVRLNRARGERLRWMFTGDDRMSQFDATWDSTFRLQAH